MYENRLLSAGFCDWNPTLTNLIPEQIPCTVHRFLMRDNLGVMLVAKGTHTILLQSTVHTMYIIVVKHTHECYLYFRQHEGGCQS